MSLFSKEIIEKIERYCLFHKLDLATFRQLCAASFDDEARECSEKLALMAESLALRAGSKTEARISFFAGLLLNSTGLGIIPYKIFNGREENKEKCEQIKACIFALLCKCSEGGIFIAHCIALQHELQSVGYGISEKDFPVNFPARAREKCLKYIEEVGKIINFCNKEIQREFEKEVLRKGVPEI
ncbi:MAG TPA: hypothetical protein P5548_02765 [Candidatus Moranbacteria bacterium]|nr:hypothetical protein [Candidatus Moranbacteria bacterium]HRZ33790.1 hypothetical protein [Candidatus Moranbacteria bacterium]